MGLTILSLGVALGLALLFSQGLLGDEGAQLFAILAAILLLPIVFIDPVHGLMVYAIVAPISPEFPLPILGIPIRVQDPLIVVIAAGMLLRRARLGSDGPRMRLRGILLTYAAFAIFVTAFAYVHSPLTQSPQWVYVFKLLQYVTLALCAGYAIRTSRHVGMLLGAAIIGLVLQFTQLESPADFAGVRLHGHGISEQANVLGCFVAFSLALVIGSADRIKLPLLRLGLLIVLAVGLMVVMETKSRTAYTALGTGLIVSLFATRNRTIPALVVAGMVIAVVLRPDFLNRAESIGAVFGVGEDQSYTDRLNAYGIIYDRLGFGILSIFFGGGWGVYSLSFADTQWGIEMLYGGVIGMGIFIVLVLMALNRAVLLWKATRDRYDAVGAVGVAGVIIMFAATASCFGLTSWSAIRTGEILFLSIGLIIGCQRIVDSERRVAHLDAFGIDSRAYGHSPHIDRC